MMSQPPCHLPPKGCRWSARAPMYRAMYLAMNLATYLALLVALIRPWQITAAEET